MSNRDQWWYKDGLHHRLDGSAIIDINGSEYWINGTQYIEYTFWSKIKVDILI